MPRNDTKNKVQWQHQQSIRTKNKPMTKRKLKFASLEM